MPSGPVEVTVAVPGTPLPWVTLTFPVCAVPVTRGVCVMYDGRTTS